MGGCWLGCVSSGVHIGNEEHRARAMRDTIRKRQGDTGRRSEERNSQVPLRRALVLVEIIGGHSVG